MKQTSQIKKYIYDWLTGLNIGQVFMDRKPMDDTTKTQPLRTYVIYYFENGIEDMGGFFQGTCTVVLGSRDKVRFTSDEISLAAVESTFLSKFDWNDEKNGIAMIHAEKVDDGPDGVGNHEYIYQFDVFVEKK